ncbi:hypothetical protein EBB07_17980 [Paenibacillaceae bacterium]|nr:hypothetical protein EBB07_17980 [Paenibacillaceae bacterium]
MKKKKWLLIATVGGMLATSAFVGAGGLVEKVSGMLHNDVKVYVDGDNTTFHPVYINGKAYLPARETAEALGYNLKWSKERLELQQRDGVEQEEYMQISGIIVDVTPVDDQYRLEVRGHGVSNWMILFADKDTVITDNAGAAVAAKDLKAGQQVNAQYGPVVALSYPGQSHAATIKVGNESLIKEGPVHAIEHTSDGWQLQFSELKDGQETPSLVLNGGKETAIVTEQGTPVEWTQIKPGTPVRAYYGPFTTRSMPPQSPANLIVVLEESLNVDAETVKEFRELAWKLVPETEKAGLITKKDEAQVSLIDAKGAAIMAANEQQKQILADIVAKEGKVISVTYSTDKDALLGPLQIVIHPETKTLIGFFIRR